MRTRPVVDQVAFQLGLNERSLQLREDGLGVFESESNILYPVTWTIAGVNWHRERLRPGILDPKFNGDFHGLTFPGMTRPIQQACD